MFKLFKKKKPVVEKFDFLAHVHTRNMGVIVIVGHYPDAEELAMRLSFLMDNYDSFTSTLVNRDKIVIRSKDIEYIRVEREVYEA
jgi:phosphohistidine phosphatase SixA